MARSGPFGPVSSPIAVRPFRHSTRQPYCYLRHDALLFFLRRTTVLPLSPIQSMVNDLERREPLSGLRSVVLPTGEVTGVTTLPATTLHWVRMLMAFNCLTARSYAHGECFSFDVPSFLPPTLFPVRRSYNGLFGTLWPRLLRSITDRSVLHPSSLILCPTVDLSAGPSLFPLVPHSILSLLGIQ